MAGAGMAGDAREAEVREAAARLLGLARGAGGRDLEVRVSTGGATVAVSAAALAAIASQAVGEGRGPAAPGADEVSPNEAAGILGVSRPTVLRLAQRGVLPYRMVGSHHRLPRAEVVAYRDANAAARREALQNLAALSQKHDF